MGTEEGGENPLSVLTAMKSEGIFSPRVMGRGSGLMIISIRSGVQVRKGVGIP